MADESWDDEDGGRGGGPGLGSLLDQVRDPRGILRRRWLPMLLFGLFGLAGTAAAVLLLEPRYQARATVLIASQRVPEDFVRPTVQEDPIERINSLIGSVLSRTSLMKLIEKHGLYADLAEQESLDTAIARMRADITIEPEQSMQPWGQNERAAIVAISFESQDPEMAADVANALANLFMLEGLKMRSEQAQLTTSFMRRELEAAEAALSEHGKRIAVFQAEHQGELPTELDSHMARLDRLQQQRQSLAMRIAEAETRLASLRTAAPVDSPRARLEELQARLAQQRAVNRETHPNVQALLRQIEIVERTPGSGGDGGLGSLAAAIGSEIGQLRQQMRETDEQIAELDGQVSRIPVVGEEYAALERRNKVLQETYLEYLRKLKEAELAESLERAQQGARVAVLDSAVPPPKPKLDPLLVVLAGLAGSLGLAIAVALGLELLDPVIVSADGLEAATGVRVLGSVPHMS